MKTRDKLAPNQGRFSLFPAWDTISTGTSTPKADAACNFKVLVSLAAVAKKAEVNPSSENKKLLDEILACRAPKVAALVESLRTKLQVPETGSEQSRERVGLPAGQPE